jgi:two-component system sensor histidine kinase KdpD
MNDTQPSAQPSPHHAEGQRPDPDELLARLQEEETSQARGKLKIFLGYVAGVGKTYAMLEAARQRRDEGIDVVIGYVETHGRKETDALVEGLEIIPRQQVAYHGATLTEMDLEAVLARRPQLLLVDELAHTNAPGGRHPKRYQDVQEILAAGIDVYTTLNVQHLESLNDVVQQITGIVVHETVPDRIVDEAYEIELIDLPTDELIQRLREGKVYISEQASRALEKFFRKGNLTALRELSLRRAAERVDHQMVTYMHNRAIPGPWPASNRIMVCISSHPMGERLVRAGRRLADDLNSGWYVVYVETPGHLHMPPENRARIQKNLRLAEELGAQVVSITSASVAQAVIDFAHEHNVTKIIAGKPLRPRWFEVLRGTVIDQIIRRSGKIDVYVVSEAADPTLPVFHRPLLKHWQPHPPFGRYFLSLLIVLAAILAGLPFHGHLDPTNLVMLFLIAVILSAVYLGRGPAILASVVSVLSFDFFFIDPRLSFTVHDTEYILTFIGLLGAGLVISNSAALLRNQVEILRRRERQMQALNNLGRDLNAAMTLDQVLEATIKNVDDLLNRDAAILLPEGARLTARMATPGITLDDAELAVAEWAFKNGQPAGRGTDTLPASRIRYMPLITTRGTIGILGVKPNDPEQYLSQEQRILIEGIANLSALAIDRASFAEKAAQNEMLQKTERLQTALLNSISHELRTPLAVITGALTSLDESAHARPGSRLDLATSQDLIESATREAGRLNHLVGNLLDMTRLEADAMRLNLDLVDVQELIAAVLQNKSPQVRQHPIVVHLAEDLPLATLDAVLIGQVLENLLENAAKFSPPGSPIEIQARMQKKALEISVKDQGSGIPPHDLERIFDKFYRVERSEPVAGTGLGLSICKGIVEAHGGRIWAANNPERGAVVTFSIPTAETG